jgi:Uma2 family endonuclease
MALTDTLEPEAFVPGRRAYLRAPKPIHFPSEETLEEAVSETKRHLEARTTLYLLLRDAFAAAAVGSDQFVYWDASDPRKCLSPDVFVKLGVRDETFESWKVWERGAPEVAVEIVSASDRRDSDWEEKMARYQASGTRELVRFDASDEAQPIRAWDRIEEDLVERAPESTHLRECKALGLWWVVTPSAFGPQLRLARDRHGKQLLPTPDEERLRLAEELAEERKARSLAEHARMLAEHARTLAEHARTLAEQKLREETEARTLAEQKLREETEARVREGKARDKVERERDGAMAELDQVRAELARVRGEQR